MSLPYNARLMKAIIQSVDEHGRQRRRNFGAAFREDDFALGAGAVVAALGQPWWKKWPARFTLGLLGNKTLFPLSEADPGPSDQDRLRYYERECQVIRDSNGWGAPGEVLEEGYSQHDDPWRIIASGYGQYWVGWYDSSSDGVNELRTFDSYDEAYAFFEWALDLPEAPTQEELEAWTYSKEPLP